MMFDTKDLVSMTEANQNFSQVTQKVDKSGLVIVLKNNKPKYIVLNFDDGLILTDDEKLEVIAKRILKENARAFKELAE